MKRPPEIDRLEQMLRRSKISATGFLGSDSRPLEEILETDSATVAAHGTTMSEIAERMKHITNMAEAGLGNTVSIDHRLTAEVTEAKGKVTCPWPHPGVYNKTVVTVRNTESGESIRWSELNIHLIAEHGFFEGLGADFRVDPEKLIRIIMYP